MTPLRKRLLEVMNAQEPHPPVEAVWSDEQLTRCKRGFLVARQLWAIENGYLPFAQVSWFGATAYCEALTQRERAAGRIAPNAVCRLPTEAEWEYACRALTSTRLSYVNGQPGITRGDAVVSE